MLDLINNNRRFVSLLTLVLLISIFGCSKDDDKSQSNTNPITESTNMMSVSEVTLYFGYFDESRSFLITNNGDVPFNWNWNDTSGTSYLTMSITSGSLPPGESQEVTVTVDRTAMVTEVYNLATSISNDIGESLPFFAQVKNYKEDKWLIDGEIIDAEYNRSNDVIIAISESPYELRKLDPFTNSFESIVLNVRPTCVSVSQDGSHAVVGHNGSFTYVNLITMEIENNFPLTIDVYDIIIAPNNWVYATSNSGYDKIKCINLANGQEVENTYDYHGNVGQYTKIKLHPSGDYIYSPSNNLTPERLSKYDIREGLIDFLYSTSIANNDYEIGGDIWISEDGSKAFTKSRNVFALSENQDDDMVYDGMLYGDDKIQTLDYSVNANRIYVILDTPINSPTYSPSNKIHRHGVNYFFMTEFEIPDYAVAVSDELFFYTARGHFGFFNSDGTKFFTIVKMIGPGFGYQWAIATIDVY